MGTKFNINREPVKDEEINSHKDFGELVNKFKKQSIQKARSDANFLKNKKITYSAIIAGAAVICTVTYFAVFKKNPPNKLADDKIITKQKDITTTSKKQNNAFIAPPIAKLNVPYTAYKLKAEQGATLKHSSNSKIIIPKKAFVNKQGQDIIGEVEIKYREFHNQADIIASGIPMAYDSAGIKSHFESAGMIDIKGYQNGEPIFIKPNKQITVEFASEQPADKFNMYELDTVAKNWVYMSRDNSLKGLKTQKEEKELKRIETTVNDKKTESPKIVELQKKLDAIPPKIEAEKVVYSKKINQLPKATSPIKPTKAITGKPQFELDVNYKEFPELEAFKNAVFEVGSENKNYNSKLADITWSSAEVSEGPVKGQNYILTLKLRERVEKLIVYPALIGANYDNALKLYETKFNDYKILAVKRDADEKKLKQEFEIKQDAFVLEQKKLNDELVQARVKQWKEEQDKLNESFSTLSNTVKVTRIFQVSRFNIFNSDCTTSLPEGEKINPIYVTNNGSSTVTPTTIYLVSHSKNLVYNLPYGPISCNAAEVYSMCILSKGKLYLCDKNTFTSILKAKQNKIPLTEVSADVKDAYDLKKAMGI